MSRGTALLFHDRGTRRCEWTEAWPDRYLTHWKFGYPFYRRTVGAWALWTGGKCRIHRDSIPDRWARSLIAISNELRGPHIYKCIHRHNIHLTILYPLQHFITRHSCYLAILQSFPTALQLLQRILHRTNGLCLTYTYLCVLCKPEIVCLSSGQYPVLLSWSTFDTIKFISAEGNIGSAHNEVVWGEGGVAPFTIHFLLTSPKCTVKFTLGMVVKT